MHISVHLTNNEVKTLTLFEKGDKLGDQTLYDKKGEVLAYDQERYFATFSPMNKLVTVQDYVVGELLKNRSDF